MHADFIGTLHAKEVLEEIAIYAASGTERPSEANLIESLNAVDGAEPKSPGRSLRKIFKCGQWHWREKRFTFTLHPIILLLQLAHPPIEPRLRRAISHVSRACKSSSIMVNLLKIAAPLNRSAWPESHIYTLPNDSVQRKSSQSMLIQRNPI